MGVQRRQGEMRSRDQEERAHSQDPDQVLRPVSGAAEGDVWVKRLIDFKSGLDKSKTANYQTITRPTRFYAAVNSHKVIGSPDVNREGIKVLKFDNHLRVHTEEMHKGRKKIHKKYATRSYAASKEFHDLYLTAMAETILKGSCEEEMLNQLIKLAHKICPAMEREPDREWHYNIGERSIEEWSGKKPKRIA